MIMHLITQSILMALGMFWEVAWSLIFGFALSACIQVFVSKEGMQKALGRDGFKEIIWAALFGAASSSCSYASASVSKTLFKKGAAFIPSLAFLFASTNLVIELGLVLFLLMGWQFVVAEWLGGFVLIAILTLLVRLTCPEHLIEEARHHQETASHEEMVTEVVEGKSWLDKIQNPTTWIQIAQHFVMEVSMLWKDIVLGFLIAGCLSAFVPMGVWRMLFVQGMSPWIQVPLNALLGPLVAMISFVCSIGNVPMAAVLWASGVSFGGVLSFIYADLIVLPLLDVYRRYYGLKMAAYMTLLFYSTMVITGIVMELFFKTIHQIPTQRPHIQAEMVHFSLNYTFWLNVLFGIVAVGLVILSRKRPVAQKHHCCH